MFFYKYHGMGNDYLVYDCSRYKMCLYPEGIRAICDHRRGLGADGMLVGPVMRDGRFSVRFCHPDGSQAMKSGIGVQIFAKYLRDAGYTAALSLEIYTIGGDVSVGYRGDQDSGITVSMGSLTFDP